MFKLICFLLNSPKKENLTTRKPEKPFPMTLGRSPTHDDEIEFRDSVNDCFPFAIDESLSRSLSLFLNVVISCFIHTGKV